MQAVWAQRDNILDFLKQPVRQQDADEWFLLSEGRRVRDVILNNYEPGNTRAFVDEHGRTLGLWGLIASKRLLWLVGTEEGHRRRRATHRLWRAELELLDLLLQETEDMGPVYAITLDHGDEEVKWHALLGFSIIHRGPYEGLKSDIVIYERRPPQWVS